MRALDRVAIAHVLNSGEQTMMPFCVLQVVTLLNIKTCFFCTFERGAAPACLLSLCRLGASFGYIGVHWADRPCNQRAVAYMNAQGFKGCWKGKVSNIRDLQYMFVLKKTVHLQQPEFFLEKRAKVI